MNTIKEPATSENNSGLKKIQSQLDNFIHLTDEGTKNRWLETTGIKIYVRKSARAFQGKLITCLDLANVEIMHKEQGVFKAILAYMKIICPWDGVLVENVHNPQLQEHMDHRVATESGWSVYSETNNTYLWLKPQILGYDELVREDILLAGDIYGYEGESQDKWKPITDFMIGHKVKNVLTSAQEMFRRPKYEKTAIDSESK
jgi:hypothetical protein